MAVELRCPECRAKLRLNEAPEADSEIECPKCGSVFPTDDNVVHAGDADEGKPLRKKPAPDGNSKEKSENKSSAATAEKKPEAASKPATADKPFKRKIRRAKKKKTNPYVLWGVIGGMATALLILASILIYLMLRTTFSQEMMSYLPDECDEVSGFNLGHLQKYPDFYKSCDVMISTTGFKKAAEVFASAAGSNADAMVEYVMQGSGKSGGKADGTPVEATVIRTKVEFDPSVLSKIPNAKEYSDSGVKYYTIDDIQQLGYPGLRVFAPTNRLVVFCRGDIPQNNFKTMLTGNKENPDAGVYKRAGPLIKKVTRGTVWHFVLYGRSAAKPTAPVQEKDSKGGVMAETDEQVLQKQVVEVLGSSQGMGYKASVGSRDVRFEWVVWLKDSDAASNLAKKLKDQDWVKDDEKTPPRWWTTLASRSGGGKTAANALKDNLSIRSSGETFSIRTSLETNILKTGVSQLASSVTGRNSGGGAPVAPKAPSGPGGGGPGAPGGPKQPNRPGK